MMAATEVITVGGSDTSKPLNIARRLGLLRRWVDPSGCRILDAGCGKGDYVLALSDLGARAEGIEFEEAKVAEWEARHPGDCRVKRGDLTQTGLPDGIFDAVLLNEVLEHVPDDHAALRELHRILKPAGLLVLFSPNRLYPLETHGVYSRSTGRHIGALRTMFLPYVPIALGSLRVRYWARNYWPGQLRKMVRSHGFDIVSHSFVWNSFENISGNQPAWIRRLAPVVRLASSFAQHIPLVQRLGVSQLIVARRQDVTVSDQLGTEAGSASS